MNRSAPIVLSLAVLLMAGCGYSHHHVANAKKHSHPSSVGTSQKKSTEGATPLEKTISYDGISLRVPISWTLGDQIKIYQSATTGSNAGELFPKMLPDSGPGITSDPGNQSPFFSEQLQIVGGSAYLQLAELGADGYSYSLQMTVPSSEAALLRAAAASMQYPPSATATDDVQFILRDAQDGSLSPTTSMVGTADRWLVVSGNPATMQEQYALFGSTNGGNEWTLLHWTTGSAQPNFPGSLGKPTVFFWSATDGIVAVSSAFSSQIWLYRTTDGGTTLTSTTLSVPSQPDKAPTLSRSPQGVLTITIPLATGAFTASSTDNGQTWSPNP